MNKTIYWPHRGLRVTLDIISKLWFIYVFGNIVDLILVICLQANYVLGGLFWKYTLSSRRKIYIACAGWHTHSHTLASKTCVQSVVTLVVITSCVLWIQVFTTVVWESVCGTQYRRCRLIITSVLRWSIDKYIWTSTCRCSNTYLSLFQHTIVVVP
mgnify:CR=1 FL=1